MTREEAGRWRWRNVPLPLSHVGGLVASGILQQLIPWSTGFEEPLGWTLGGPLLVVGLLVVVWAVRTAGRQRVDAPTVLLTRGPYEYSRNPMYVGWTAGYVGIALLADSVWPLAWFPVVALAVHREVRREERFLEDRFGADYRRYRREVRRYL